MLENAKVKACSKLESSALFDVQKGVLPINERNTDGRETLSVLGI